MSDAAVSINVTFGRGTTPPAVLEAVERAVAERPRLVLPAPTRSEVDAFFGELAELVKRAKAGET